MSQTEIVYISTGLFALGVLYNFIGSAVASYISLQAESSYYSPVVVPFSAALPTLRSIVTLGAGIFFAALMVPILKTRLGVDGSGIAFSLTILGVALPLVCFYVVDYWKTKDLGQLDGWQAALGHVIVCLSCMGVFECVLLIAESLWTTPWGIDFAFLARRCVDGVFVISLGSLMIGMNVRKYSAIENPRVLRNLKTFRPKQFSKNVALSTMLMLLGACLLRIAIGPLSLSSAKDFNLLMATGLLVVSNCGVLLSNRDRTIKWPHVKSVWLLLPSLVLIGLAVLFWPRLSIGLTANHFALKAPGTVAVTVITVAAVALLLRVVHYDRVKEHLPSMALFIGMALVYGVAGIVVCLGAKNEGLAWDNITGTAGFVWTLESLAMSYLSGRTGIKDTGRVVTAAKVADAAMCLCGVGSAFLVVAGLLLSMPLLVLFGAAAGFAAAICLGVVYYLLRVRPKVQ